MYKRVFCTLILLAGCGQPYRMPPQQPRQPQATVLPAPPPTLSQTKPVDFNDWKNQFQRKAQAAGFNNQNINRLLASANYEEKTVKSDRSQPESNPMVWQYLDKAVSKSRINQGRKLMAGRQFVVPSQYVMAIWAMESGFGQNMGNSYLPSALATLAYDGRRREFAETQLLALLKLIEEGALNWNNLNGSWAGGMGHTQFIPATFLEFGVDGDGDGRRDPFNEADALASTANYLKKSGWQGQRWGEVVRLPPNFLQNQSQNLEQPLSAEALNRIGVRKLNGQNTDQPGRLWLPGGQNGSALLLYQNFDVIKVYNNSDNYALAISLLADGMAGRATNLNFPRHEQALSGSEARLLQQRLNEQGFNVGNADGKLGKKTRQAFRAWQQRNGQAADGFISRNSVQGLL